jgi:hypothetical protein
MSDKLQVFEQALKSHDWYYDYSDDHRVWRRGTEQHDALLKMRKELKQEHDPAVIDALWSKYSPFSKENRS